MLLGSTDAVARVVASLEARVVGAEATLGAVGNAEEKANAAPVVTNARHVTRGAPAHDATARQGGGGSVGLAPLKWGRLRTSV